MSVDLFIENNAIIYQPPVESGITWDTDRVGSPGKLNFKVLSDETLKIEEGNIVTLVVDGTGIFAGYIFSRKYDKESNIDITAYDQLRYLKNKETYNYSNKTASDVVEMIAADFALNLGIIEKTGYIIPQRHESNTALFDIIYNALDLEIGNKGKLFVLFDDFGKLSLKSADNMMIPILIDEETGENFDFTSSIDEKTYNVVKYGYKDAKTEEGKIIFSPPAEYENGKRELTENQKKWGILQEFILDQNTFMSEAQARAKADTILSLYNHPAKKLKINGVFGDIRVRAGCYVAVRLNLGGAVINDKFMLVDKCTHTWSEGEHFMDLTLRGNDIGNE